MKFNKIVYHFACGLSIGFVWWNCYICFCCVIFVCHLFFWLKGFTRLVRKIYDWLFKWSFFYSFVHLLDVDVHLNLNFIGFPLHMPIAKSHRNMCHCTCLPSTVLCDWICCHFRDEGTRAHTRISPRTSVTSIQFYKLFSFCSNLSCTVGCLFVSV